MKFSSPIWTCGNSAQVSIVSIFNNRTGGWCRISDRQLLWIIVGTLTLREFLWWVWRPNFLFLYGGEGVFPWTLTSEDLWFSSSRKEMRPRELILFPDELVELEGIKDFIEWSCLRSSGKGLAWRMVNGTIVKLWVRMLTLNPSSQPLL